MPSAVLWLVASYFIGAIPTSYLLSRFFAGIDLRRQGSGNLGATNLYRVLGWKYAIPAALVDIAKGFIPVVVFAPQQSPSQLFALACGVAAIIGHVFSVFVGFKGGKGVATAAGVMLGLTPLALGVSAAAWAVMVRITGYVSLASICAAAILPVGVYLLEDAQTPALLWIATAIAVGVIVLHRRNIERLLKGTESRFGRRAASTPNP
jgi:acyl phosphate:glycerol-3-phosphate acyltransferase